MPQSTTPQTITQAFPKVSQRLLLRGEAAIAASRRGVAPAVAQAAVDAAWRATRGDRYAARRAGWAAVDAAAVRYFGSPGYGVAVALGADPMPEGEG